MKIYFLTSAWFIASLTGLIGCQSNNGEGNTYREPVKVKVMQITPIEMNANYRFSGTVEEANETPLSFSVAGTIYNVAIQLGDHVKKGQLLASLETTSMQSTYDAAKASLTQAEDAYNRMKELHDKGSLAEIKWIETQSKLQQARSMEEVARKNLQDCNLYAPFNGVISEKSVEVGENVMPGVPIGKIVGISRLKVKISVPETEISNVALQQQAFIAVPALNGATFHGIVTEKGVVANPLSRSYEVKIEIEGTDKSLLPGMVTEVALENKSDRQTRCIVPAHIVQLDEYNNSFVWLNNNGKATKRIITCGEYTADGVIVVSGLSAGDEIIVEGQQKVCENTEVSL